MSDQKAKIILVTKMLEMYHSAFAHLNYCADVSILLSTHIVDTAEFHNRTVQVQWHLSTILFIYLNSKLVGYCVLKVD